MCNKYLTYPDAYKPDGTLSEQLQQFISLEGKFARWFLNLLHSLPLHSQILYKNENLLQQTQRSCLVIVIYKQQHNQLMTGTLLTMRFYACELDDKNNYNKRKKKVLEHYEEIIIMVLWSTTSTPANLWTCGVHLGITCHFYLHIWWLCSPAILPWGLCMWFDYAQVLVAKLQITCEIT